MRALLACVTVCLLVLQGFAYTCRAAPGRQSGAAISVAHVQAPHCHRAGDEQAPATSSHDCCVYCSVAGRDALTPFIAVVADFVLAPTPSVVATVHYQTNIRNPVPLGLTTSWSPRAPPQIG